MSDRWFELLYFESYQSASLLQDYEKLRVSVLLLRVSVLLLRVSVLLTVVLFLFSVL